MNNCPHDWPEQIVRVQTLSENTVIPDRYINPLTERPTSDHLSLHADIPFIDFQPLLSPHNNVENDTIRAATLARIDEACRDWGFFQIVNHGVGEELMEETQKIWREFFHSPMEMKQKYANSPETYEGYESRLGVEKGAMLDWSDYYFLHFLPNCLKDHNKWPSIPDGREVIDEYGREVVKLCGRLMKAFSLNLGLGEDLLQQKFGGQDIGACLRVNFYPKCPQPDLTLGLSSHSDPGGMTLLLCDEHVAGLQVRKDNGWITVKPAPRAFIVNVGNCREIFWYTDAANEVPTENNEEIFWQLSSTLYRYRTSARCIQNIQWRFHTPCSTICSYSRKREFAHVPDLGSVTWFSLRRSFQDNCYPRGEHPSTVEGYHKNTY